MGPWSPWDSGPGTLVLGPGRTIRLRCLARASPGWPARLRSSVERPGRVLVPGGQRHRRVADAEASGYLHGARVERSMPGRNCGASYRSISVQRPPRRSRSIASLSPTRPPPTTRDLRPRLRHQSTRASSRAPANPAPVARRRKRSRRVPNYSSRNLEMALTNCWGAVVMPSWAWPSSSVMRASGRTAARASVT